MKGNVPKGIVNSGIRKLQLLKKLGKVTWCTCLCCCAELRRMSTYSLVPHQNVCESKFDVFLKSSLTNWEYLACFQEMSKIFMEMLLFSCM